jgi:hypothetical protein
MSRKAMLIAGGCALIGALQLGHIPLCVLATTDRYVVRFMLCPHGGVTGSVNASKLTQSNSSGWVVMVGADIL